MAASACCKWLRVRPKGSSNKDSASANRWRVPATAGAALSDTREEATEEVVAARAAAIGKEVFMPEL